MRDRNRISGAGITAGLDFRFAMVAEPARLNLRRVHSTRERVRSPPNISRWSIKRAPAEIKTAIVQLLSGFAAKAEALAAMKRLASTFGILENSPPGLVL